MRQATLSVVLGSALALGCFSDPSGTPSDNNGNNGNNVSNETTGSNNGACDASAPAGEKLGDVCVVGAGGCERTGEFVCNEEGIGTQCSVEAGTPGAELCDEVDNDCDGEVDEGFDLGEECAVGIGGCEAVAAFVCGQEGGAICPATAGEPTDELCGDGVDNDCDGETDEGFEGLGDSCSAGIGACEVEGAMVCTDDGTGVECDAMEGAPPEADEMTCDGIDNDCDGETDEGCDDDVDGWCDAAMTAMQPDSDVVCPNGVGDCNDDDNEIYPGAPARCDQVDTDCDGVADPLAPMTQWDTDLQGVVSTSSEISPILAAPSPTGFCVAFTGTDGMALTRHRAHLDTINDTVGEAGAPVVGTEIVADLVASGGDCVAVIRRDDGDASFDGTLYRWNPDLSDEGSLPVAQDAITHIQGSWDVSLAAAPQGVVLAYVPTAGNAAKHVTVQNGFSNVTVATMPANAGLIGEFPVVGPHPGAAEFLYFANFANINVGEFDTAVDYMSVPGLQISSSTSREEMVLEDVGGTVFHAVHNTASGARAFEIREVTNALTYGRSVDVPYAVSSSQDYVNRRLFAPGPPGAVALFAEPVGDKLYQLADAGGMLTYDEVDGRAGELLAVRDAGGGYFEALWMLDAGVVGGVDRASFQVVEYCY